MIQVVEATESAENTDPNIYHLNVKQLWNYPECGAARYSGNVFPVWVRSANLHIRFCVDSFIQYAKSKPHVPFLVTLDLLTLRDDFSHATPPGNIHFQTKPHRQSFKVRCVRPHPNPTLNGVLSCRNAYDRTVALFGKNRSKILVTNDIAVVFNKSQARVRCFAEIHQN